VAALASVLREFQPPGVALLAVEFRGYGPSTGTPTVAATERDVEAVWRWLAARPELDSTRVVVYGRSVGSGPATLLASSHAVTGLILESPFTSLRAMARVHYPFLPSALAGTRFDNLARITHTRCPVLVIHGDRDGVIPTEEGREIARAAGARAEFWAIPGADHNETYDAGGDEYVRRFKTFVAHVVER
ncbi:MAG TPA: alpha/beta family hydrolase, partial [Dongiaceae bacterium]|nr:alpha/beta family hydrolase [Dongiaceae bacterium]